MACKLGGGGGAQEAGQSQDRWLRLMPARLIRTATVRERLAGLPPGRSLTVAVRIVILRLP
jgi:hypothetical protein